MICAIGQDSHRFDNENLEKALVLGGLLIEDHQGLKGNSDADVVLHAITNAISGITGVNILGNIADKMCNENGITDSKAYLLEAMKYLEKEICHISVSIECKTPHLEKIIPAMKENIASILNLKSSNIGITATTGEGLTDFGRGLGIQCFCIINVQ